MTELELYKYINDNGIEWHRQDNDGTPDIIIFPYIFQLEEFCKLVMGYESEEGVILRLFGGYVAIWMQDLCDYYGIDIDKVFMGDEQ
jgi:hypothetical protein